MNRSATVATPYLLRRDEGEALWFFDSLATLKATGAGTGGALTVAHFVNPAGFAPPPHRHLVDDEMFYVLAGDAVFTCGEDRFAAGPGDFVFLPKGRAHTFHVGDAPLEALQLTTPAGFEDFAAGVGVPAAERRVPDPMPVDPAALGHALARFADYVEILGPPGA